MPWVYQGLICKEKINVHFFIVFFVNFYLLNVSFYGTLELRKCNWDNYNHFQIFIFIILDRYELDLSQELN